MGKIIDIIEQNGFKISNIKMQRLQHNEAAELFATQRDNPFIQDLVSFVSQDVVVGLELVRDNAIAKLQQIMGPANSLTAKNQSPSSIRGMFGKDSLRNAIHGSDSAAAYAHETMCFFQAPHFSKTSAQLNNCSCAIIKPHVMQSKQLGKILDEVLEEGFEVSALEMFYLDKSSAEEFFEVYKGVLPEFVPMIDHLCSGGPCIVLEVR